MMFQQALLLLSLHLIPLSAAAELAHAPHEARQGPISTQPLSQGPDPASLQASSLTSKATMSSMSSSEPSFFSSSITSRMSSFASSSSHPVPSSTLLAGSPSSSASKTSSATPQPSSSASGIVFAIKNMTTCTSGLISWNYSGTDAQLSLSITNTDVEDTSSLQSTLNPTIQQQLVVTSTTAKNWTWPSVNVTQGWYEIEGVVSTASTVKNNSVPFFISNGTNVVCLTLQASSTPSLSGTSSASSNINVASIVGGVLGGFVGVVLVIVGVYLWMQKKRRLQVVGDGGSTNRKWGSLKSTNSSLQAEGSGAQVPRTHFHAHSESTGAIIQDDACGKVSAMLAPGGSVVDVTTGEEKIATPTTSSSMSPFEARYGSMYSVPATVTSEGTRSSATRRISNQSLEQQAQRIRSSMETTIRRRSERLSVPTIPSPSLARIPPSPSRMQAKEEYPLSPVTPTPVNRSVSTGAVSMNARRASRKPVPQYDPSLLEDTKADSVSTLTAGVESSQSHGTGMACGTPPDFIHNAGIGDGRPVHYLIPDMPSLQPD